MVVEITFKCFANPLYCGFVFDSQVVQVQPAVELGHLNVAGCHFFASLPTQQVSEKGCESPAMEFEAEIFPEGRNRI